MKKLLILLFSLTSIVGYSQTLVDPSLTPTTARINAAIADAVAASGTDTYTGTKSGLSNVTDRAYSVKFPNANTGASSFNLNGGGAVALRKFEGGVLVALAAGDIAQNETKRLRYNGTYLVIEEGSGSGGGISELEVGTTDITSGTDTRVLYNNAGTLGEYTISGTGNVAMTTSPVFTTPDIGSATGSISGNAATVTTNANLTGDVTSTGNTTSYNTTVPVGKGGTGVTASSGASSVVLRDANQNITANNSLLGYATTATAAGTTTLTVSSARDQYFTGSTTQTVVLPVVSTLTLGHTFLIINNSTGIVTVQTSGSNVVQAMAANSTLREECILTSGTGTASWSSLYTVSNPMTTWGDIVYGGDPGAGGVAPLTKLGPGTAGYVLSTNGSGAAPSWIAAGGLSGLTATQVTVANSGTSVVSYNGFKWDDTGRLLTVGYSTAGSNTLNLHPTGTTGIIANLSTGETRFGSSASHFYTFYTNNAEAMRINGTTRDFLIGTTTDNSKLTVNGSVAFGYVAKTANYTATISDYTIECTANTFQVTLPTAVGIAGREYVIINSGAGTITVGTTSSQTFVNVTATPTTLTMATVGSRVVISNGANWMLKNSL